MAKLSIVKWTEQGRVNMDKLLDQHKPINFPADKSKFLQFLTRPDPPKFTQKILIRSNPTRGHFFATVSRIVVDNTVKIIHEISATE